MKARVSNGTALKKLFSFMRPYWLPYLFGTTLYSGQGFFSSYLASLLMSWLTAAMLSGIIPRVFEAVLRYSVLMVGYFVLLAVGVYLFVINAEKAMRDLKAKLFRSFVHDSIEGRMDSHSGEGIAAINTEADLAGGMYANALCSFAGCLMSIVFSAVIIFAVDWRLGLASVAVGLLALIPQYRFAGPLSRISTQRLESNSAATRTMSGILSGGASIRAFGMEPRMAQAFAKDNAKLLALSIKEAGIAAWQNLFFTLQGWLSLAAVFGVGGLLVAGGQLSFAQLMLVPALATALAQGLSGIGGAWAAMQGPIAACTRLAPMLDVADLPETAGRGWQDWDRDATLRIAGLTFRYASAQADALKDVTLTVAPNRMVALVGPSGSGKSTLLKAVVGLYEREALPIWMGNMRHGEVGARSWRENFAYVDQSSKLFDMTIAENIGLGLAGATQEQIERAAAEAGADAFIRALPEGYDTPCGEHGSHLSGGQKQRIAIARALVRRAPVLVFDEVTSALDAESERMVLDTINELRKTHTILMATHNLEQTRSADLIAVFVDGQLVQSGTYGELAGGSGVYAQLLAGREISGAEQEGTDA